MSDYSVCHKTFRSKCIILNTSPHDRVNVDVNVRFIPSLWSHVLRVCSFHQTPLLSCMFTHQCHDSLQHAWCALCGVFFSIIQSVRIKSVCGNQFHSMYLMILYKLLSAYISLSAYAHLNACIPAHLNEYEIYMYMHMHALNMQHCKLL